MYFISDYKVLVYNLKENIYGAGTATAVSLVMKHSTTSPLSSVQLTS